VDSRQYQAGMISQGRLKRRRLRRARSAYNWKFWIDLLAPLLLFNCEGDCLDAKLVRVTSKVRRTDKSC
jgi:hypothetical protein